MWAGVEVFRAGDRLVGVEFDSEETARALRERCSEWSAGVDDLVGDVPAAYGVRSAKVGLRRRRVGVVHHGAPVRFRLPTPGEAIDVIARILADVARARRPSSVTVDARCFVRDGRAVLVDVPRSRDVDERPLVAAGLREVPAWRPLVDPHRRVVEVLGEAWPLAGLATIGQTVLDLDGCRRQLFSTGEGDELAWADLLDAMGDRLVWGVDDVGEACERALR